jgi:hypothetical protein
MSEQQLVKIQILEKQLQAVNEHPGANNIKKTPAFIHENRLSNGSLRKSLATITPRSDVKREVLSTPRRPARVQRQDSMTLTPSKATTEIDTTTSTLAKLGRMVIEQLQNSGGAIRQIQDSMGAVQGPHETATQRVSMSTPMEKVQGPYETTTRRVSMSNSGGAVQTSRNAPPWANSQAGEETTIQQDLAENTKGESWRAEWEETWERYKRQESFQEAF